MIRHLDHIEHFVHEQAVPVVVEADHEVRAAGRRFCVDQTKPASHVNDRNDPASEMEEADHRLSCVRHAGDPSIAQHLCHARRGDREAVAADEKAAVAGVVVDV